MILQLDFLKLETETLPDPEAVLAFLLFWPRLSLVLLLLLIFPGKYE